MRHKVFGRKLSRDVKQRKALFKNLISALFLRGGIETTESKAKTVRRLAEKLIARGREGTLHARRLIAAFLQNKEAVNRVVNEIGPIFKNQPGGFTRLIRLGRRRGDNTMMARLELVKKPEGKPEPKPVKNKPADKKSAILKTQPNQTQ